jgi:hypothetical protein
MSVLPEQIRLRAWRVVLSDNHSWAVAGNCRYELTDASLGANSGMD